MNFKGYCPLLSKEGAKKECAKENCTWYCNNECVVFSILNELKNITSNTSYISDCDVSSNVSEILSILNKKP